MTKAAARRVFFAVWPDDEAVAHLSALARELTPRGGRLIDPASLHLTLTFVGRVSPAGIDQLSEIAAAVRAEAFDLRLDRLGFWPQGGILWAGCRQTPAPWRQLAGQLAGSLLAAGFAIDVRGGATQIPHVTLARHARSASLPRLGTGIGWRADEFALVESLLQTAGARYRTLAKFGLAAADDG